MVDWQYHDNSLGPLANWPLDEYVGGEYEDISGNALPLTVESGTQRDADLVPGFAGTWLDGSTVLVENTGAAALRLLGDWSIAFFVMPTAYPGAAVGAEMATHGVPNAETAESDNFAYQTKLTQTAARVAATWETTGQVDVDVTTIAALVSHVGGHVALVKRGLDFEVYLDTVLVATATASGQPVGGGSGKFRFGGGTTGAGLAAVVASLVVFGEAITPSELFGVAPPVPPPADSVDWLAGFEGPIDGGTDLSLVSTTLFDFTAEEDTFTTSILTPLWTDASSGGAVHPTANGLWLVARGTGAASQDARLRTVATVDEVDLEFAMSATVATDMRRTPELHAPVLAEVGLYVDADTRVRCRWRPGNRLEVLATRDGVELARAETVTDRPRTARLVRAASRTLVYANGARVADVEWSAAAANIEVAAVSGPTGELRDRVRLLLQGYRRRPVFVFGDALAPDFKLSDTQRQVIISPPYPRPATVDLVCYGAGSASVTLTDAFRYTLGSRTPLRTGRGTLYVLEVPSG